MKHIAIQVARTGFWIGLIEGVLYTAYWLLLAPEYAWSPRTLMVPFVALIFGVPVGLAFLGVKQAEHGSWGAGWLLVVVGGTVTVFLAVQEIWRAPLENDLLMKLLLIVLLFAAPLLVLVGGILLLAADALPAHREKQEDNPIYRRLE
ncbi:MAG TPA: hypothetical protein VH186_01075 [Chloroflexia bacterium]|nr:hypothetical protein [Chloroflexia bacterium]